MPHKDINAPPVCPYCTLKMHCEKHRGQPYHGKTAGVNRPQDAPGTLDRLYNELIGSKLERFQREEGKSNEKEQKKLYWASLLERQRNPELKMRDKVKKSKKKSSKKRHKAEKHGKTSKHKSYRTSRRRSSTETASLSDVSFSSGSSESGSTERPSRSSKADKVDSHHHRHNSERSRKRKHRRGRSRSLSRSISEEFHSE